ncbi:unnamed protein product [Polarella glacialis]|uniref:Uncharacterized protein n=1 Tax=Polarella glacialis TaxID=89957 RepID=A0A813F1Q1_POLGL|nr:unnamed protein product [Polarella glacialis]
MPGLRFSSSVFPDRQEYVGAMSVGVVVVVVVVSFSTELYNTCISQSRCAGRIGLIACEIDLDALSFPTDKYDTFMAHTWCTGHMAKYAAPLYYTSWVAALWLEQLQAFWLLH